MADPLDGGYPALYEAANKASLRGQSLFMWSLRIRLGGLLVATVGAAGFIALQMHQAAGWSALVGFVSALCAEIYTAVAKPDRQWYEGRAAAESAKTLTWRYAVAGESFETGTPDVDRLFVGELRAMLKDLKDVDLAESTGAADQITPRMRELRAGSYLERKSAFAEGRIDDQRSWYARKATWNRDRQHRWTFAVIAAEGLGVLGGAATIAYELTFDLLGIFAAVAATATAWVQAKQHSNLATAYGITAQELASIHSEIAAIPETEWGGFVGQSEEAISREHTLWRASRGV